LPELKLEGLAELRHLSAAMVTDLQRLGPFGHGNRRPVLCFKATEVSSLPRRVGRNGDHLQLIVKQGESFMKCIAFGYGELYDHLKPGTKVDLAVEPILNDYNGITSVELEIKDLQFPII
jgi:single-stranded-DNA-specific exonuclease